MMAMNRGVPNSNLLGLSLFAQENDAILLEGRPWKSIGGPDMNLWDKKHTVSNAATWSVNYAQESHSIFFGLRTRYCKFVICPSSKRFGT